MLLVKGFLLATILLVCAAIIILGIIAREDVPMREGRSISFRMEAGGDSSLELIIPEGKLLYVIPYNGSLIGKDDRHICDLTSPLGKIWIDDMDIEDIMGGEASILFKGGRKEMIISSSS